MKTAIKNSTHTADLIKEKGNIAMYEITNDETGESHGFYVVREDNGQVKSAIPADMPESGTWYANGTGASAVYMLRMVANDKQHRSGLESSQVDNQAWLPPAHIDV